MNLTDILSVGFAVVSLAFSIPDIVMGSNDPGREESSMLHSLALVFRALRLLRIFGLFRGAKTIRR